MRSGKRAGSGSRRIECLSFVHEQPEYYDAVGIGLANEHEALVQLLLDATEVPSNRVAGGSVSAGLSRRQRASLGGSSATGSS